MRIIKQIHRIAKNLGYIYIFYYENVVEFYAEGEESVFVFEKLHKIGVSRYPKRRFSQVKSDVPGKLYYVGAWPIFSPYSFEKEIHRKYSKYQQTPIEAGPRAGSTEFFNFNNLYIGKKRVENRRKHYNRVVFYILLKWAILRIFIPAILMLIIAIFLISNQQLIIKLFDLIDFR
jgi:hypothetical protein